MTNNIIISSALHLLLIIITALSLPFLAKKPIDLPPIVSIELIQITDKTSIPYAPKAKKIIEEIKKKEKEKLVSEKHRLENDIDYIEKLAREKYRMAKKGEKVFKVIEKED